MHIVKKKEYKGIYFASVPVEAVREINGLFNNDHARYNAILIFSAILYHVHKEMRAYVVGKTVRREVVVKPGESWISLTTIYHRLRKVHAKIKNGKPITYDLLKYYVRVMGKAGLFKSRFAAGSGSRGHYGCVYTIREDLLQNERKIHPLKMPLGKDFSNDCQWIDVAKTRKTERTTVRRGTRPKGKTGLKTHVARNHPKRHLATAFDYSEIVLDVDFAGYDPNETYQKRLHRWNTLNRLYKFARRFRMAFGGRIEFYYTGGRGIHIHISRSRLNVVWRDHDALVRIIERFAQRMGVAHMIDFSTLSPSQLAGMAGKTHDDSLLEGRLAVKRRFKVFEEKYYPEIDLYELVADVCPDTDVKGTRGFVRTMDLVKDGIEEGQPWGFGKCGRDWAAFCISLDLLREGKSDQEILNILRSWNRKNRKPLQEKVLVQKVRSARRFLSKQMVFV